MRLSVSAGLIAGTVLHGLTAAAPPPDLDLPNPRFGEDLIVDHRLPLPAAGTTTETERHLALSLELEPSVWYWRGEARFATPQAEDPDKAWHRYMEKHFFETDAAELVEGHDLKTVHVASDPTDEQAQRWIGVDLETGFEYDIELSSEFGRKLHARLREAGLASGYPGVDDPRADERGVGLVTDQERRFDAASAGPVAHGWSNGVDSRTRRFNNTTYPYRTMGQLGGGQFSGCSGTLIGRRHVLTAAHCLYNTDSGVWSTGTRFRPGREGTCNSAACEPYGEFTVRWLFTPAEFRTAENKWTYDYGILVTNGSPGNSTGWMGYVAANSNTTRDYCDLVPFGPGFLGGNCFNRGYPACGFSEAPDNCVQGWAYQDVNPCEIGSFGSVGPDGWWSRVSVNCDSSRGHSGSALFTDVWNGSGKVVFGVNSTSSCRTCSPGSNFPDVYRRVTPDVLGWISYFKTVAFP